MLPSESLDWIYLEIWISAPWDGKLLLFINRLGRQSLRAFEPGSMSTSNYHETQNMTPKIAFVIHRYGEEVIGGAESQCRNYAEMVAKWCDVTVLTSCASSYHTWANDLAAGESLINGVRVIRFPSSCQRHPQHHRWWDIWQKRGRTIQDECQWIYEQGPVLPELLAYLAHSHDVYDVFIFFTYLYYPTVMGLPLVHQG
jgi:hypothetical protein